MKTKDMLLQILKNQRDILRYISSGYIHEDYPNLRIKETEEILKKGKVKGE